MINFANVKEWKIPYNGSLADVIRVKDTNNTRIIWEKTSIRPGYSDPFWIENVSNDNGYVEFKGRDYYGATMPNITVQYRVNGGSLSSITISGTTPKYVSIPANAKVEFYAETSTWSDGGYPYVGINILNTNYSEISPYPPSVNIGGNILSMIYGASFRNYSSLPNTAMFYQWLMGCTVVDASNLCLFEPQKNGCYESMLSNCGRLTSAPLLPFTNLTADCYIHMFAYCTSLVTAPVLPATTATNSCYEGMFSHCTSLTTAPSLPATTLGEWCYNGMFAYCTSLVTAPVLPATNLVDECYYKMFSNCTSLNNVICLATNMNVEDPTYEWLDGVSSTGTFTKAAGVTWPTGTSGIPSGWTVVNQ